MGYRLIKGTFQLSYQGATRFVGSQPDGDSLWFKPDSPNLLNNVGGRSAELNGGGMAQLRFEGIDALETHYKGTHQNWSLAIQSRDFLLAHAGFSNITFTEKGLHVRTYSPPSLRGYILTRAIDPFGRPVAFVFGGSTSRTDGSDVWLDSQGLRDSFNYHSIRNGESYPAYYTGLPYDLRDTLTEQTFHAWDRNFGVWTGDSSSSGARVSNLTQLQTHALWPKLFRRLVSCFKDGASGLESFDNWLRADSDRDDEVWIIPEAREGNMHDLISVSGNRISMRYWPEEIIIRPR